MFTLTREMQLGTTQFTLVRDKQSDAVAYLYTSKNGKPAAAVFYGKSNKPVSRYYYSNEHARELAVTRSFEGRRTTNKWKEERKTERAKPHTLKVGDILGGSWGYDQTNIDFFEVVATTAKTVTVRELRQSRNENGWCRGTCVPLAGQYTNREPSTHRASAGNMITSPIHGHASMWDGKAENWTAYA